MSLSRMLTSSIVILALAACGGGGSGSAPANQGSSVPQTPTTSAPQPFTYAPPQARADGLTVADASVYGMDVTLLESLMDHIRANDLGFRRMDGIAIMQRGELIFEAQLRTNTDFTDEWASNNDPNLHAVHSVTKSVMSAVVGIAIEQNFIPSTDALALNYFQQYLPLNNDSAQKQAMTIEDWLTMRSGLAWNEWDVNYTNQSNQNSQMINAPDPIQFLLDTPMASVPGTDFAYSTGISFALGKLVEEATGRRFFAYMRDELFTPLGIANFDFWNLDNTLHTGSALYLSLRDMAKLGQLFLDNGQWQGQQLIPEAWVQRSTLEHVNQSNIRYGYQWWLHDFNLEGQLYPSIFASGWGGQYIYFIPSLESVIVLTGRRYQDGDHAETSIPTIMQDFILPMLEGGAE